VLINIWLDQRSNLFFENITDFLTKSVGSMTSILELSSLRGRVALITGAAGALGRVFSDTLAELGADLILVDRKGTEIDHLGEELTRMWGVGVRHRYCDLEQQDARTDLVNWVLASDSPISILINNAAFIGDTELDGWSVPFEAQSVDTWRRAIEVNLTAPFDLCQGLTPALRKSKGASIVNISSIYGQFGPDWGLYDGTSMGNPAAYSTSKGGLIQLTRWLATTVAPDVRVNSISAGGIFRNQPFDFVKRYEGKTPLARMANEDDFRGAIAYLASDLSKYVTGHNLIVDGGWGVW
jgi:NAD(P)-dependent dehydrogenase (short-subunit alcohol dehydrogenase family)